MLVFWLAHVYAHALAWRLDSNEGFSRASLRPDRARASGRSCRPRSSPRSRSSPVGIGLISARAAYWIAIGYGVAALIWWGLLFARKERMSVLATTAVVLVNASFGLCIVLLKEFVSH